MSMWIDQKYIGMLSVQLDRFKRQGQYKFNFRCPICGDSQKSKTKARGYVFANGSSLFYKCHNCQFGSNLGELIKNVDPNLYREYCVERYTNGETGRKSHKMSNYISEPPKFGNSNHKSDFDSILTPIKKLDKNHEILKYVRFRKIPCDRYNTLYYVDNIQNLKKLVPEYQDKILTDEPRLVIPFYNRGGKLVGLSARGIRGEKFRYLNLKIDENDPMIFGIDKVDVSKTIYVTEGPIDSLFLPNSVAAGNANLRVVEKYLPKDKLVLVYDNEPRNSEIVKNMQRSVDEGFSMCVWPKSYIEKDINDMVIKSISVGELVATLEDRTFSGPRLMLEFNSWRI